MGERNKGIYQKFETIKRVDGSSEPGGKHDGCAYFVLDITHDPFAAAALDAYAAACANEYPFLSNDLFNAAARNRSNIARSQGAAAGSPRDEAGAEAELDSGDGEGRCASCGHSVNTHLSDADCKAEDCECKQYEPSRRPNFTPLADRKAWAVVGRSTGYVLCGTITPSEGNAQRRLARMHKDAKRRDEWGEWGYPIEGEAEYDVRQVEITEPSEPLTDAEWLAITAFFDFGATRGNYDDSGYGTQPGYLSQYLAPMQSALAKLRASRASAPPPTNGEA